MTILRRTRATVSAPSPSTDSPIVRRTRSAPALKLVPSPPAVAPDPQDDDKPRSGETDYAGIIARYMARVKNPMTAIRARCIQCTAGQIAEVKLCPSRECALHPFRMGKNVYNLKTRKRLAAEAGISLEEYDRQHGTGAEGDEDDAE